MLTTSEKLKTIHSQQPGQHS